VAEKLAKSTKNTGLAGLGVIKSENCLTESKKATILGQSIAHTIEPLINVFCRYGQQNNHIP
jgi:hypothetical protein